MFKGSITALITPFTKDGEIDWPAFDKFVEWQVEQGSDGVVPCGTTGESPVLSHAEHKKVVKRCVEIVNKRIPVIAGTGSNNTAEAIELTQEAKDDGADAALIVTPYYNKPSQDGLYAHYKTINDTVDIPVILYNVPGRSIIDLANETVARLAQLKNIVGIKDATADLTRPVIMRNEIGDDFCLLTGEDGTTGAYLSQGGDGAISVSSNVAPQLCAQVHKEWANGNIEKFQELNALLSPLHDAMFCESSPAPVKYATSLLGLSTDHVRLPLLSASNKAQALVTQAMEYAGLLDSANKINKVVNG